MMDFEMELGVLINKWIEGTSIEDMLDALDLQISLLEVRDASENPGLSRYRFPEP